MFIILRILHRVAQHKFSFCNWPGSTSTCAASHLQSPCSPKPIFGLTEQACTQLLDYGRKDNLRAPHLPPHWFLLFTIPNISVQTSITCLRLRKAKNVFRMLLSWAICTWHALLASIFFVKIFCSLEKQYLPFFSQKRQLQVVGLVSWLHLPETP